jgi:glucose-1-phosphate adenylyltransferase
MIDKPVADVEQEGDVLPSDEKSRYNTAAAAIDHMNMARTTRAMVLAGGETRNPLTKYRAMPAVPIGSCMFLIDVPINNCLGAGINKVYVVTQFQSHGLHSHIAASYPPQALGGLGTDGGWVDVLTAQQTISGKEWYKGSADAVRRNLHELKDESRGVAPATDYVILSGSAMYNMDMTKVVGFHRIKDADITICSHFVSSDSASTKGVLSADEFGKVLGFQEKPDKAFFETREKGREVKDDEEVLVNMGVYVFKRETLFELLGPENGEDMTHIGHHLIPKALSSGLKVYTYEHDGYWQDVSTLKDYYQANLALTSSEAPIKFFEVDGAVSARGRMLPPARMQGKVHVSESILGDGCILVDCTVTNSIVGENVLIGPGSVVEESLVLGSPMWVSEQDRSVARGRGDLVFGIGDNVHLKGCIVDENAYVGNGCKIVNTQGIQEADCSEKGYMIEDGIVVILKNAIIPDGTTI